MKHYLSNISIAIAISLAILIAFICGIDFGINMIPDIQL